MEFNEKDGKFISSNDIVFDVMLTSGRFADIYKARYLPHNNKAKQNVIAKTLKSKSKIILLIVY